jgi:hypothetical protein
MKLNSPQLIENKQSASRQIATKFNFSVEKAKTPRAFSSRACRGVSPRARRLCGKVFRTLPPRGPAAVFLSTFNFGLSTAFLSAVSVLSDLGDLCALCGESVCLCSPQRGFPARFFFQLSTVDCQLPSSPWSLSSPISVTSVHSVVSLFVFAPPARFSSAVFLSTFNCGLSTAFLC